jgi:hypothetical protein
VPHGTLRVVGYRSKQISIGGIAIMIFHRGVRVSSKMPYDKASTAHLRDVQQAAH